MENTDTSNNIDVKAAPTPQPQDIEISKKKENRFSLGDLVSLKTHPLYESEEIGIKIEKPTNDTKNIVSSPRTTVPAMVITEAVKEANKIIHDIKTGEQIASIWKYKCQYYSWKDGLFKENWFYEDLLAKINIIIDDKLPSKQITNAKYDFGRNTTLKTFWYDEKYARYLQHFKPRIVRKPVIKPNTIIAKYATPFMIMISKSENKIETPIFKTNSKGEKEVIREVSLYKIKCMWYNPIDAKFSEDWFIPEALIEIK
ncbi:MAG: hypothetical protein EAZ08_06860 [Cytophagales bacterium]|nr:MAG: hypothetical protein EAZ08_06860 [Cytophagales bacterium]